jgi:Beta-propeller repeat
MGTRIAGMSGIRLRDQALRGIAASALPFLLLSSTAYGSESESRGIPRSPTVSVRTGLSVFVGFTENRGQWPAEVRYFARAGGVEATLTDNAMVLRRLPGDPDDPNTWAAPVVMRWPSTASASRIVEGETQLETMTNYFLGDDASRWVTDVPSFDQVVYRDVMPGIDVVIRIDASSGISRFAYDLLLAPGADLADFVIELEGASYREDSGATLAMETSTGEILTQRIGACWQPGDDGKAAQPIEAKFRRMTTEETDANGLRFGFEAPQRDVDRPFVLDPSFEWSTYVGGQNLDYFKDMAVDPAGATYVTGYTVGGMPTTPGAFQTAASTGGADGWVGKLSPDGSTLVWATFVGGKNADTPSDIAVGPDGSVYIAGSTWSATYPVTAGCVQPQHSGTTATADLFATRLNPSGSALIFSTFYGSPFQDYFSAMNVFPNGDAVVVGYPEVGQPPPATAGAYDTNYAFGEIFIARISAAGTQVVFQTFFSSAGAHDVEIDSEGSIIFAGLLGATAMPLPTTPDVLKPTATGTDLEGIIVKMSGDGTQLKWCTYFGGGEGAEDILDLALDPAGMIYITGRVDSDDMPTTPGAFDTVLSGQNDGFVAKIHRNATAIVWSTYLGSTCCQGGGSQSGLTVDSSGCVYTVGNSNEAQFPTTADALQPHYTGPFPGGDAHLTKFDPFGESLIYSTWYAGTGTEYGGKIALDGEQNPRMVFESSSSDLPVTPGVYDSVANGSSDYVIAKFDFSTMPIELLPGSKPGAKEHPNLAAGGWLTAGSPTRIALRGAKQNAPAWLIAGFGALNAPMFGGTFIPTPDIVVPIATNATGAFDLAFTWPTVPAGIPLYIQCWIADAGGQGGFSASNGVKLTSQ